MCVCIHIIKKNMYVFQVTLFPFMKIYILCLQGHTWFVILLNILKVEITVLLKYLNWEFSLDLFNQKVFVIFGLYTYNVYCQNNILM